MDNNSNLPRVVILTALSLEYQAIRNHLKDFHRETHPQGTVYGRGIFISKKPLWDVGIVETRAGNSRAAFEAERAIEYFKPSLVLFVGVAGGLKDVKIGDVVVATKVYSYESGKAGETFKTRAEVGNSTYRMVQRAQAEVNERGWLRRLGRSIPEPSPRVFIGAIAAGEKVVASTQSGTWKLLKMSYDDTLAVEMEGYGFLQATQANQHVEALIIRGISDLIDGKSEVDAANFQTIAANHASAFAFEILAKLAIDDISSSSRSTKKKVEQPIQAKQAMSKYNIQTKGDVLHQIVGDNLHVNIKHGNEPTIE